MLKCRPVEFTQSSNLSQLTSTCNDLCQCQEQKYQPVCGADGITYFSPCHAGCTIANMSLPISNRVSLFNITSMSIYLTVKANYVVSVPNKMEIYLLSRYTITVVVLLHQVFIKMLF